MNPIHAKAQARRQQPLSARLLMAAHAAALLLVAGLVLGLTVLLVRALQ